MKKPVITAEVINEFGQFDTEGVDEDGRIDGLHTPGFSDMRKERDTALKSFAEGDIKGNEVPTLPVNVRWVRNTKVGTDGQPDIRIVQSKGQGYRTVSEKIDFGQRWPTDMPPGAYWAQDGTLRKGDLTLMVCDQQTAARNRFRQQATTMKQVEGGASAKLAELRSISAKAEPTVDILPSQGPIKSADVFKNVD